MKILIFADLHMCPKSSVLNKWGSRNTMRLENCVESVNWLERLAETKNCDAIVNLGDFFDKPDLSSETITALKDIHWSNIIHYNLVGNHDASTSSLEFNAVNCLANQSIQACPETEYTIDDVELCFLPYVTESDRKPLEEYFGERVSKKRIIFSHNDIQGIQMGPVISKTGFSLEEIHANCDLFFNGHLHNGQQLSEKAINLGNLTGKDFGEDANRYLHRVAILDTDSMQIEWVENPHAFNFYKIEVNNETDLKQFSKLKNNSVLSIKCNKNYLEQVKEILDTASNIIESRLIVTKEYEEAEVETEDIDLSVDHIARFVDCCKAKLENSTLLDEEIAEICK